MTPQHQTKLANGNPTPSQSKLARMVKLAELSMCHYLHIRSTNDWLPTSNILLFDLVQCLVKFSLVLRTTDMGSCAGSLQQLPRNCRYFYRPENSNTCGVNEVTRHGNMSIMVISVWCIFVRHNFPSRFAGMMAQLKRNGVAWIQNNMVPSCPKHPMSIASLTSLCFSEMKHSLFFSYC